MKHLFTGSHWVSWNRLCFRFRLLLFKGEVETKVVLSLIGRTSERWFSAERRDSCQMQNSRTLSWSVHSGRLERPRAEAPATRGLRGEGGPGAPGTARRSWLTAASWEARPGLLPSPTLKTNARSPRPGHPGSSSGTLGGCLGSRARGRAALICGPPAGPRREQHSAVLVVSAMLDVLYSSFKRYVNL